VVIKKKILFSALSLLYIFSGCEPIPSLSVSTSSVKVPSTATQRTVTVNTNTKWGISGSNDWCSVSPSSGDGTAQVSINISANNTKEPRSVKLTVSAGGLSSELNVLQEQDDALILTERAVSISSAGGNITVELKSNIEYDVIIPPEIDWISELKSKGFDSYSHSFSISGNNTYESREAIVVFKDKKSSLSDTLTITQGQKDGLMLSERTVSVPSCGGSVDVELQSNISYDIILPQEAPWITLAETKSLSLYSHRLDISENQTYDSRSAKVIFKDKNSTLSDTLTVTQAQKDGLILTAKNVDISSLGGIVDVELQSNILYDIIMPPGISWITTPATKGLSLYHHQFYVSANSSYDERSASIIFKDKTSQLADTLTIHQEKKEALYLDMSIAFIPKEGGTLSLTLTSNVDYNVTTVNGSGWISLLATRSMDTRNLRYAISANPTSADRTGQLIFTSASGNTSDTVTIVQSGTSGHYVYIREGESLASLIPASELSSIKNLRVEGIVDPEDFTLMGSSMPELEILDLGNALISGNHIPEGSFRTVPPATRKLKTITLPASLRSVGNQAFYYCTNLIDPAFPQGLYEIGNYAFAGCSSINSLALPSSLAIIGDYAFYNCFNLNYVRSFIDQPPTLNNSFYGISPNSDLVVNTGKLSAYLSTVGWGNTFFNRIYETGTNPDDILSLDKTSLISAGRTNTQTVNLSASSSWTVESKPSWVTLSATSGTGGGPVNVTFSSNTGGSERNGTVTFKLDNSDLRAYLELKQYGNSYTDGECITVQNATVGNGVNVVFMGDGFTLADIAAGTYDNAMNTAITHFFGIEPYTTYRNYFNVHIVYVYSSESGISDISTTRNTALKVKYEEAPPSTYMSADDNACFGYADNAPVASLSTTLIVVVANSTRYGGTTSIWSSGHAIAICPISSNGYPYDFRGVVQHEAGGHGFGGCADEYVTKSGYITQEEKNTLAQWQGFGFFDNVSVTNNLSEIRWKHFIGLANYSYVGAWEGAYYYPLGVWRPEQSSCMINNIKYYNAPSREMVVKRIMSRAGMTYSFDDFKAKDVMQLEAATKSTALKPDPAKILHSPVLIKGAPGYRH
jgi:hypothetical protein